MSRTYADTGREKNISIIKRGVCSYSVALVAIQAAESLQLHVTEAGDTIRNPAEAELRRAVVASSGFELRRFGIHENVSLTSVSRFSQNQNTFISSLIDFTLQWQQKGWLSPVETASWVCDAGSLCTYQLDA